jgi:hypothetical protein
MTEQEEMEQRRRKFVAALKQQAESNGRLVLIGGDDDFELHKAPYCFVTKSGVRVHCGHTEDDPCPLDSQEAK